MPLVFIAKPDTDDRLVHIQYQGSKRTVRHRTLKIEIPRAECPLLREAPLSAEAKRPRVVPILWAVAEIKGPKKRVIRPRVNFHRLVTRILEPLDVRFHANCLRELDTVTERQNRRELEGRVEIAFRNRRGKRG
ncbi:hypothetical protein SDC9_202095 [bioreactor metagenome]|uniref:Uncharacterized protein n=1 Tax=bioreactor metagenome TaxID=1076179 RepID=A0A645ISQ2_9ZZZZ